MNKQTEEAMFRNKTEISTTAQIAKGLCDQAKARQGNTQMLVIDLIKGLMVDIEMDCLSLTANIKKARDE